MDHHGANYNFQLTLEFDLVLNHQGLALIVNFLGKFGRNGMMGRWIFHYQSLVAVDTLKDSGFLHSPGSNIGPVFFCFRVLLLCMRRRPSRIPVIGELLQEWSFKRCGLAGEVSLRQLSDFIRPNEVGDIL